MSSSLTPKAFANSSLGQRPRETSSRNHWNAEGVRETPTHIFANAFSVLETSSLAIPGALPQA